MQALSNLDASFLHLETEHTPMHVGGVMLFAVPGNGPMTFNRFRDHVIARLQTARVFRQRLYTPPGFIDNPVWVEDADFHIDHHLRHRVISSPLTQQALEPLCSKYFATPLRRDQPLWEMMFVRTADPQDGFAVVLKVHHAALDGISAEAVITGLLDFSPTPRTLPADTWQAESRPQLGDVVRRRLGEIRHAPTGAKVLLRAAAGVAGRMVKHAITGENYLLPRYFTAPETVFNRPVQAERRYFGVQMSLSQIKAIKSSREGLTVNDVVLAICAGATRRYLLECGSLPEASLVAMAPVSRRAESEKGQAGNKVAAMLIRLATDVADPLQRLQCVHDNAMLAKDYNREVPVDSLLELLPSMAPGVALSAFSGLKIGRRLPPVFNTVITNVPGSPAPLYLDGAPMHSISGMVGVYDNMALSFVVMSYLKQLSIGITCTPDAIQRPELLVKFLHESADELMRAVQPAGKGGVVPLKAALRVVDGGQQACA